MLRCFDRLNYDAPAVLNNASTFPFMTWLSNDLKREKHSGGSVLLFTQAVWFGQKILEEFTEFCWEYNMVSNYF